MLPNVVLTSLIAGYSCLQFFSSQKIYSSSQFAFYLSLSHSVISKSLAQPFCKCCSLSVSIVLNVRFTANGICVTTPVWREQTEIKLARRGIFIVAWCHSVKVCALAALPFQSQQSGALTRMWRWCQVQPSQKERAIGVLFWKNEGCCCNLAVGHRHVGSHLLQAQCCVALSQPNKESNRQFSGYEDNSNCDYAFG